MLSSTLVVTRTPAYVLAALLLAGCLTVADVPRYKSEGVARIYPVTVDEAWMIAKEVFRWGGASAFEEHRAEGYMLTSTGANLHNQGTVMGAWVEGVDATNTQVIVVMKRRLQSSVLITMTETTFHRRFAEMVASLRAERPLPQAAPR
jgi:hypothetical protein